MPPFPPAPHISLAFPYSSDSPVVMHRSSVTVVHFFTRMIIAVTTVFVLVSMALVTAASGPLCLVVPLFVSSPYFVNHVYSRPYDGLKAWIAIFPVVIVLASTRSFASFDCTPILSTASSILYLARRCLDSGL